MENTNRDRQYKDSARFVSISILGIIILMSIMVLVGCTTTKKTKKCCDKEHVITEWDGDRQINWYTCKNKSYGSERTN